MDFKPLHEKIKLVGIAIFLNEKNSDVSNVYSDTSLWLFLGF